MAADSSTTDVKARPILFSGPMVRALLSGQKTQTRRVINPQPAPFVQATPDSHPPARPEPYLDSYCGEKKTPENPRGMSRDWCWWTRDNRPGPTVARCPYGVPGDRLWVRETFRPVRFPGKPVVGIHYVATENPYNDALVALKLGQHYHFPDDVGPDQQWPEGFACKTRSSIYMPRWASRLTLEVTEVRVQRLQDISEEDAKAEGCGGYVYGHGPISDTELMVEPGYMHPRFYRAGFEDVWQMLNAKRAPWDSNPWVWAISFKVIR